MKDYNLLTFSLKKIYYLLPAFYFIASGYYLMILLELELEKELKAKFFFDKCC